MKTRLAFMFFTVLMSFAANAGVDLTGKVTRVWLKSDDRLWFRLDNASVDTYCKRGWYDFNLYIPATHKDFAFYFSLITSANANGQQLRVSNISKFNGTTACNVLDTGYGIVVHPPAQ